jgi:hypothetical protein
VRTLLTACTDRTFFHATMPLAGLRCGAATPVNDNRVQPQVRPASRPRNLVPNRLASHVAQQAARALLSAAQRGLPVGARQATWLTASPHQSSLTSTKVRLRSTLGRAFGLGVRPEAPSVLAFTPPGPPPQSCAIAGPGASFSAGRSLSPKAPLYWF